MYRLQWRRVSARISPWFRGNNRIHFGYVLEWLERLKTPLGVGQVLSSAGSFCIWMIWDGRGLITDMKSWDYLAYHFFLRRRHGHYTPHCNPAYITAFSLPYVACPSLFALRCLILHGLITRGDLRSTEPVSAISSSPASLAIHCH